MASMNWLWEHHLLLMHQCFSLPFSFLFYFLASRGYLSLTYRYLYVLVGGCLLAVITMGIYSAILFTSSFVFILLVCTVDPSCIHAWVFAIQMLWQTSWHLLIQYREYYLQEPICIRLFLAVSSLMLLTQRITSVSMDLQEKQVILFNSSSKTTGCVMLLSLSSYILNFTTQLGGPLCSYSRFVSLMTEIRPKPPPNPLGVVFLKLLQVWGLALVLRIQYYSHWRISECLNNAAGFGFWENSSGASTDWGGLSDGDIWTTEASSRISEFARRWNTTTALWLRRVVYMRCKRFPLFMTFSFSLWWHGLHLGHFVGFYTWAAMVKADYYIHKHMCLKLSPTWRKIHTVLSWINTQMIVSCIVIAVEIRNMSGLRLLSTTYIGLFPLLNVMLLFILQKLNTNLM